MKTYIEPTPGGSFGAAVAISGNTVAIGAPCQLNKPVSEYGTKHRTVLIYTWDGDTPVPQQSIVSPASGDCDGWFGNSLAIEDDTLLVGAPFANENSRNYVGSAYLYTRVNGTWTQAARFSVPGQIGSEYFGKAVALSAAGDATFVSASQN
ncbi:MAG TPA: FG-GAP repeat protein [Anaerolineaceae bacterium]|nr:FG-GAP repeat protein [Anaerolineaceae bacterium]